MNIEVELTDKDYKLYRRFRFWRYDKGYRLPFIFGLIILVYFQWTSEYTSLLSRMAGTLIFLFAWSIFLAIGVGIIYVFDKLVRKPDKPPIGKHIFSLNEDVFSEENSFERIEVPYSTFLKLISVKDYLYLMTINGKAFIIPKRAFMNLLQQEKFISYMDERISHNPI